MLRTQDASPSAPIAESRRIGVRRVAWILLTVLALLAIWVALVMPNELGHLTPGAFVRIPVEALVVVLALLVLPARARRPVAALFGMVVGIIFVFKILDMGFYEVLDRPFNPVTDRGYFGPGVGVLGDAVGRDTAHVVAVAAVVAIVLVPVGLALASMRMAGLTAAHRRTTVRVVAALGLVWVFCAVTGARLAPSAPIASSSAVSLAYDEVRDARLAVADQHAFVRDTKVDAYRKTPPDQLLTALRGKDVIVAFVESYGRSALERPSIAPGVQATLAEGEQQLRSAGFDSRSAFMHSPTFGAGSWLAHASLQSGLWVDSELRYDTLMTSDRFTLSQAFGRAGWRTVVDVPANSRPWPDGRLFYKFDRTYGAADVGYQGPKFSYAAMPDQYTLSAFQRMELARQDRAPVFAEIDLTSSHNPWTPVPHMIDWADVGDGSVYDGMPEQGLSPEEVWPDPAKVQTAYGKTIEYTLESLFSFVQTYGDDDLVLIVLGDHQPHTIVSGEDADHDVPVSVIAHDPKVMERIAGWGWQPGVAPSPDAPVWPMDAFRDRFLQTFGSTAGKAN